MPSPLSPTRLDLHAHQAQMHLLASGSELRCVRGHLTVLAFPGSGWPVRVLATGQAMHFAQPTWVTLQADAEATASVVSLPAPVPAEPPQSAAQKESRQGLAGLWRLGRQRLQSITRGLRAA